MMSTQDRDMPNLSPILICNRIEIKSKKIIKIELINYNRSRHSIVFETRGLAKMGLTQNVI